MALEPVQELKHARLRVSFLAGQVHVLQPELRAQAGGPLVVW